ncbi:hypothetical protein BTJ68_04077 [Hortaea werneckii EXF-2000]|uniref:Uncharacterized protein n=1 Tax=Hortaea werneckii EXF-2000 TaxID=1157616 RepID=A0A1Z5TER7_HORWE|nr:hypothetical protein BTJ68_04077 [Hortaea werneckii EXF-2000]
MAYSSYMYLDIGMHTVVKPSRTEIKDKVAHIRTMASHDQHCRRADDKTRPPLVATRVDV